MNWIKGEGRMKKNVLMWLGVMLVAGALQAGVTDKLSMRLNGGIGLISKGGDIKDLFASTYKRMAYLGHTGNLGSEYKSLGYTGSLELDYAVARKFSLAFATGYIAKAWTSEYNFKTMYKNPSSGETEKGMYEFSLGSIPLVLTGYYHTGVKNVGIHVGAGAGAYVTSLKYSENWHYSDPNRKGNANYSWIVDSNIDLDTKTSFGFHAVAGASVPISKFISFEVNALYRNVSMDDFTGSWSEVDKTTWTGHSETKSYSQKGTKLWLEESNGLGFKTLTLDWGATKPNSESARLFKVDLSGFYFNAGIKIDLGILSK
jgi:hypothetical protein